ncbi:MAG: carbohydrate-binding family V/XII [Candidatus Eisenbacteria bacterium]
MASLRTNRSILHPGPGRGLVERVIPSALVALVMGAALVVATPLRADTPSWPRQFDSSSGTIVIYQPQAEDLRDDLLSSRAAFSLQKSADTSPTFGVLWFDEQIVIDRDSSTVTARHFDVTKVRLPGITAADASRYEQIIEAEAAQWDLSQSLEELQAGLAATERERASVATLDNTPPHIVFSAERAILVVYDGAPTLEAIEGSSLERVANTPYAVIYDPSSRKYYLSGANLWYWAQDPKGPWAEVAEIPAAVRAVVPPDTAADDQVQGSAPIVLTATEPTELIWSDGPPQYAPLVDDELLYVTNTESNVVREISTQALYVLLAGRWYRAKSADGPWSFVRGDQLPASFKRIPLDSPKGDILASVAGTDQAEDAVADAEIPQTSAILRSDDSFEVAYDGAPDFETIDGTDLRYAVNTDAEVIFADGRYYACDQGVWYVADSPDGPWRVSDTRPLDVDEIPPSCPVYNVRYVYIYDVTPGVIYVGYLPGYVGCYPYFGTVVYGTGYHYRPWRGRHHYYPRPMTWGFHACYNPWLSRWSFGYSYGTGFLRTGWRSRQRPPHHGPPLWFGPGGYRRPLLDADRMPIRTRRPRPQRPDVADRAPTNLYSRPENVVRVDRTASRMPLHRVATTPPRPVALPNNVFAGKDGKVYQRDTRGGWTVNDGRSWRPTTVPVTPAPSVPAITPSRPATPMPQSTPAGGVSGGARPAERPSPPKPYDWPAPRQAAPTPYPMARPQTPSISPTPGNLEREFHARDRVVATPPPVARPAPVKPAPAKPSPPKGKTPPEDKR